MIPWLQKSLLDDGDAFETVIQAKLRGNILHILCESAKAGLAREVAIARLVRSLLQPEVKARLESDFPHIYQIYLYSKEASATKPVWSAPIYLNRLDRHLKRVEQWEKRSEDRRQKHQLEKTTDSDFDQVVKPGDHKGQDQPSPDQLPLAQSASGQSTTDQFRSVSTLDLARQGNSDAIAQYLGEALSALNVSVKVSARVLPGKSSELDTGAPTAAGDDERHQESALSSRLWILCEASYSPDPLVIAEPISQRLRQLRLRQFHDAVITIQVTGETASDWRLRVDLTPPEEMLQRWGRWGDVPALSCLVNQISKSYGLKLIAEVKKDTLHLISYSIDATTQSTRTAKTHTEKTSSLSTSADSTSADSTSADKSRSEIEVEALVAAVASRLRAIAPQGLQRAVLYGPSTDDISPEWLKSIDLPALQRPALKETAKDLAAKGDIEALSYCLIRALNPDIREQLATGGIRVQILEKDSLLHIMTDGPICPSKAVIVPLISQLLKQIQPSGLDGVRLYGRRAGQKQPIWSYGQDYRVRERLVPEATAEFAASDAYAGELITSVSDHDIANETAVDDDADIHLGSVIKRALQRMLLKSQVFTPLDDGDNLPVNLPSAFQSDGGKMALFWGAAGVLLAIQFDFMVGQALQQAAVPLKTVEETTVEETIDSGRQLDDQFNDELSRLNWKRGQETDRQWNRLETNQRDQRSESFFGSSQVEAGDFTSAVDNRELLYSPKQSVIEREALLAGSELPSFRSQQLDEKLALYRRRVEQSGPPEVLVIGSSRALRGVDPVALKAALAESGYKDLDVFNFGVNGATAQVVDLVIQRLIAPNQLPQVIIWADGARAFNSGRTDITFNAIAVSEGYRQLEASDPVNGVDALALGSIADQLAVRATETDQELSETFGQVSSAYGNRDKVRSAIGQGLTAIFPREGFPWTGPFETGLELAGEGNADGAILDQEASLIDYDGFLPLPNRFNPATYYQNHPRVAGDYDSDYEAFRLDGEQSDALRSLLRFTTNKEIPVVFVNTPLTDEYLDSYRTRAEDIFTQYMLQVAERYPNFTFRDLGQLWPEEYDYFSDPSHLNRYGAYRVSQRLSQDPLIPWPQTF
ncbi:hypothetical protein IQ256_16155 [cf. Phormidesmis sp. LEGE 11477]|nr:hypothetical protein [cf. Phormidesmis sp. LEGE 11477]